jgi:hypothetical protein
MPAIARPRTAAPQPSCDNRPEFQHPVAHRLVRDIELGVRIHAGLD